MAERILIVAPSWVGDAILSESLVAVLRDEPLEDPLVDVFAPPWCAPVYARMRGIGEIIESPFRHGELGLAQRRALGREIRSRGYTCCFVLPNSFKSALIPWLAGIPRRIGYGGEARRPLLTDARRRERLVGAMGEVERLLGAARVTVDFESPTSDAARQCLESYFRELAERFEGGYDAAKDRSAPDAEMAPPAGRFIVARLDGDPVGCGAVKPVDGQAGEIKRVWVAKSARGLGVARRMLRKLEAAALEMGLAILRLDTNKALTEAHALYRKEGYREVERFNDNPYAHHWFEKRL